MDWQSKFEHLLLAFLEAKTSTQINDDLEQLLIHFRKQEVRELQCSLVTHPIFTKWITQAILTWSTKKITPPINITCFTLNLASFLSKNEETFCSLNINNFYIKMVKILKMRQTAVVPTAYINLLSAFLEHKSGIEWMTASNFWEDIYKETLSEDNEKIVSESTLFMAKLLENTIDHDRDFCDNVVQKLMTPLSDKIYKSLKAAKSVDDVNENVAWGHLKATLKLVGNILSYFMEGVYFDRNDFGVLFLFLKNFHLEERISDFKFIAMSKNLVFDIAKIMYVMQFLELYLKTSTNTISLEDINSTVRRIRTNFIATIAKKEYENVIDFCKFGILYWHVVESKISGISLSSGKFSTSSDCLMMLLTSSIFFVIMRYCYTNFIELEQRVLENNIREIFVNKMVKSANEDVIRICFNWRKKYQNYPNVFGVCVKTLSLLKSSLKYLSTDEAIRVFTTCVYVSSDIIRAVKESPQKLDVFVQQPAFFCLTFEITRLCIENFQIKWTDSYETIEVMALCFDYLTLPEWPLEVVVQIFKLINVAIINYMSPNLALLVDDASNSPLSLLGPLLYSKLLEKDVKMAALEVVNVLVKLSLEFPSIHEVLLNSQLPTLIMKMSSSDEDNLVRASSIKCLQNMIQSDDIWNGVLKSENSNNFFQQQMCGILFNETDGNICAEAATFVRVAYHRRRFFQEELNSIYEAMVYSSTTELHWEVKIRALDFWQKVIDNHLQNEGMIDGSFPSVTFSKENRKIITLTELEIRKRIIKVLHQLSSVGCLGVLVSIIKDDIDMEVSNTAMKIVQRLVDLFKKYDVKPAFLKSHSGSSKNKIVILEDVLMTDYDSARKIVTPEEFLQFCQQNLDTFLSKKKNWLNGIEGLDLLLDNILMKL